MSNPHTYAVDFETYYDADISVETLGPWGYHRHRDTAAYLVSIAGTDGLLYCGDPAAAPWGAIAGGVWVSHNAAFDQLAYLRLGAPGGGPAEWHCTADLAAYLQAPRSLAGACRELLGVTVDKSTRDRMKGVRWADLNAIGQAEVIEYGQGDADRCLEWWTRYGDQWPAHERELSAHGRRMMMQGIPTDTAARDAGIAALKARLDTARAGIPWASDPKAKPLSHKALAAYCAAEGIPCPESLAKDDEDFAAWLETYADDHPVVRNMGEWRRVNTLLEKALIMQRWSEGDALYCSLRYFGGKATGRWSGKSGDKDTDSGFNPQNLPRDELSGVNMRSWLRAPVGHTFVIADLSQIEPRILAHLAGNTAMLEAVRGGWHIYEAFARSLGWDFKQGTLKDSNKAGYAMAKGMCLGLGYGMSAEKFTKAAPTLTGGAYRPSQADAMRAVRDFRTKNAGVVGLWNQMDAHLRESVKDGHAEIKLPSGRSIQYFDLQADRRGVSGLTVRGDKRRKNLYGALVVENIVQATARDVFAEALLRLHEAGVDVRLHVHDEAVALCRVDEAAEVARVMERCMTTPPEWMPDLPLGCEVQITEVYCK